MCQLGRATIPGYVVKQQCKCCWESNFFDETDIWISGLWVKQSHFVSPPPRQIEFGIPYPRSTEEMSNCPQSTHLKNDRARIHNQVCLMSKANIINSTKLSRSLTSSVRFQALWSLIKWHSKSTCGDRWASSPLSPSHSYLYRRKPHSRSSCYLRIQGGFTGKLQWPRCLRVGTGVLHPLLCPTQSLENAFAH